MFSNGNKTINILADDFQTEYLMQCTIAHALEKTKYPDSDKYWRKYDNKYHFASQFTADLIAMNNADFIITSTYIPGDCENVSL